MATFSLRTRSVRAFLADETGVAAVELALLMPAALLFMALAVFGGEGLGIQRKVTLAARTVTDIVAQVSPSSYASSVNYGVVTTATLNYYLSLAALIVYPYDATQLKIELTEISVTSGSTSGTVVWSKAYNGGTARTVGSSVTLSSNVVASGATNILLGETQYNYAPVGIANVLGSMTISGQIFMIPRSASKICIDTSPC